MSRLFLATLASVVFLASCGLGNPATAKLTAEEVIVRLKSAGLPIADVLAYTAETDPNKLLGRPSQYTSKAVFRDSRVPASTARGLDAGGSVEVFASTDDLKRRKEYVENLAKSLPMAVEYDYSAGLVLLRLSRTLTPEQAAEYQKAMASVIK